MPKAKIKAVLSAFLALVLVATLALPATAYATQSDVRVTDHSSSQSAGTPITGVIIGDVDAPKAGSQLDDKAVVSTKEGKSWEIPVLWIDSNLQLAATAVEGQRYLPALAFYLPADCTVADADNTGAFTVSLAPDLVKLFGNEDIVSVYDEATGVTYLLPASLRNFFAHTSNAPAPTNEPAATTEQSATTQATAEQTTTVQVAATPSMAELVNLYCSQSAKDALSVEELEYFMDLVLNKLHPQAVNLLREKFPAFDKAVANGEIGTQIGFYVYYNTGDSDEHPEHSLAPADALAYVDGHPKQMDDRVAFVYMLAINVALASDKDGSGRVTIARTGEKATDLQNTLVHELFHAYMYDYNRTGMAGATSEDDLVVDPKNATEQQVISYGLTRYPVWFVEGTASAVENVFQYRRNLFNLLYAEVPTLNYAAGSKDAILHNFLSAKFKGDPVGFQLTNAATGGEDSEGNYIDSTASRYVSGHLATLYLSSMAAESAGLGQAVTTQNGTTTVSSETIRKGFNSILERMHNGETLDQVIADISKDASGKSRYLDTDDFENTFVCGESQGKGYAGDAPSIAFVTSFMGYMQAISADTSRANAANGSVLFDFDRDFAGPLDSSKNATTDVLNIAYSNLPVESTVPNSTALAGGGKSKSGKDAQTSTATTGTGDDQKDDLDLDLGGTTGDDATGDVAASDVDDDVLSAAGAASAASAASAEAASDTTSAEPLSTESAAADSTTTQATSAELAAAAKVAATTTTDATSDSDTGTE